MERAAVSIAVVFIGLMCSALVSAGPAAEKDQVCWGEAVAGLQMSITPTKAIYEADESPEFRVALRNSGEADLVLNLGFVLGNGKKQYPTAIRLFITDSSGKRRELHLVGPPGVRGRVDDFVVPLPAGATYTLRAILKDYWCPATKEFGIKLAEGQYQIAGVYEGKGPQYVSGDMEGIGPMRFWRGSVASSTTTFVIVEDREASSREPGAKAPETSGDPCPRRCSTLPSDRGGPLGTLAVALPSNAMGPGVWVPDRRSEQVVRLKAEGLPSGYRRRLAA